MAEQSFNSIINNLKAGEYAPVYFLYGEEPYFIDEIINYIENNVIDEAIRDFNQTIVYGRDVTARQVVDLATRFPMMGDKQVVIVKEAQDLTANNRKLDDLEPYLSKPSESTILVLGYKYKKIDKRKTFYKKINKLPQIVIFESKKFYDNQIPGWIKQYVVNQGYYIDDVSTQLLADHVGNDLGRLVNEVKKLFINLPESGKITTEIIEKYIGISKDFNIFEFTKALGFRDTFKAQQIVNYFEANQKNNPLPMITVMLYNYFVKIFLIHYYTKKNEPNIAAKIGLSPFFIREYKAAAKNYPVPVVRKIIGEIKTLDLKSKGYGMVDGNNYGPLREFVYKCIHQKFPANITTE